MLCFGFIEIRYCLLVDEVLYLRQNLLPPPMADEMMKIRHDGSLTQLNITKTSRMEMHFNWGVLISAAIGNCNAHNYVSVQLSRNF